MLIGSNVFNFGQFVYHFIAGRMLGKENYGELASIISVMTYFGIIQLALGLTIVKFIASQKKKKEIGNLIKWFNYWGISLGLILGLFLLAVSPFLVNFLNIDHVWSVYILGPATFLLVVVYIQRSMLQGLLKFDKLIFSYLIEVGVKLLLTVLLVYLGYAVFGAMAAILLSVIFGFWVTRTSLSAYLEGKRDQIPALSPIFKYSLPVLLQGLALNSIYSTDLVLVKHFFPAPEAGIYASLSVLGRVVLFGSTPIASVMFPYVAKRFAEGKPFLKIFYLSFLAASMVSLGLIALYLLLPELVIKVLFGSQFLEGAPYLWWFAVFMALLALSTLLIQFYLSINKTRVVALFVMAAAMQAILIWFVHPDILTVIKISILTVALLLVALFVYFAYVTFGRRPGLQAREDNSR